MAQIKQKILAVDDRPGNLHTFKKILAKLPVEVHTSESGHDALALVLRNDYALILMDVNMPGMDGFETAELIRGYQTSNFTPIIFVSAAMDDEENAFRGYEAGAVGFVLKPINPRILISQARVFLTLDKQRRALDLMERLKSSQAALQEEIRERKKAEDEVRALNMVLEQRVKRKTHELEKEVHERQRVEELHANVLQCLFDSVLICDGEGVVSSMNMAVERMFHLSQTQIIGQEVKQLLPDFNVEDYQLALATTAEKASGDLSRGQMKKMNGRRADGELFPVELSISVLIVRDRKFFALAARDVSLQHKTEEELRNARYLAEHANQAKNQFLANMSHELRTPLNSIIGFSDLLLLKKFGDLNKKQTSFVMNVKSSGRHLLDLIDDILDFAKIEAGQETLELTLIEFSLFLESLHTLFLPQARKKNIELQIDCNEDVRQVTADRAALRSILANLISNAIKYTRESGQVTLTIEPNVSKDRQSVLRFTVADNGIGISAKKLESVFDAFQRVDSSYSRQQQGTGLGLALTKRLVELHGGRIWVESEGLEGLGSRFIFELPMTIKESSPEHCPYEILGEGPLILIIEDDLQTAALWWELLTSNGFAAVSASDGQTGLQLAEELKPALIVLDINLPKIDGFSVIAALKESPITSDIHVLVVSSLSKRSEVDDLVFDWLVKPCSGNDFMEAIQQALPERSERILLISNDEKKKLKDYSESLRTLGYFVRVAADSKETLDLVAEETPDLIVLDLPLFEQKTKKIIEDLQMAEITPRIPMIVLEGSGAAIATFVKVSKQNALKVVDEIKRHFLSATKLQLESGH